MRKITFLCFVLLFFTKVESQNTIIAGDSTNLEINSSLIQIDSSLGNVWQIGLPQKSFFGTSQSVPYSVMTDTIAYYPVNNLSSFTVEYADSSGLPVFDIALGFWHKFETDTLQDGGYVEISVDSGVTWTNVILVNSAPFVNMTNFYIATDTITGNIPAFSGAQSNWEYSEIFFQWVLPVISEHTDGMPRDLITNKIMFRFNFKSDSTQTNKAGWIIDDITLREYALGGGIAEGKLADFEVVVYPHPITEKGIIQAVARNNEHGFTINIYNSIGQRIITSTMDNNNQYVIGSNILNDGLYFYSVCSEGGTYKNGKLLIK